MTNEIRIANKKHVWHLVQRGILTALDFDFEAYGLNLQFANLLSYGIVKGDIAGNLSDVTEVQVRGTDRAFPTPQALAVVKQSPAELHNEDRIPHRVAMAHFAQQFEEGVMDAAKFCAADNGRWIRTVNRKGDNPYHHSHHEQILHYPLFDPDKKMEVSKDGTIKSDPSGMLKLNGKGQVVFGPEEKLVTIPKQVGVERDEKTGKEFPIYDYLPMTPEDGAITFDVRLHPGRKRMSYCFDEDPNSPYYEGFENLYYEDAKDRSQAKSNDEIGGKKWRWREPALKVGGYRIKWFDIPVLRSALLKAGFHPSNIFFTHSRATISRKQLGKNLASDGYQTVLRTLLQGPQGEQGLKAGKRTDPRTGETAYSAKLDLIVPENTRDENPQRKIRKGITMPDGSNYDPKKGHNSPAYDSLASFQAVNHCREIAWEVVKQSELEADDNYLRDTLSANDLREEYAPVYAMMRSNYPDAPSLDPVLHVSMDQLRRIVAVRLDLGDLRKYTFGANKKTLAEMAKEDLREQNPENWNFVKMIREQGRGEKALIRIEGLRKFPGMSKISDVLHSPQARNWNIEDFDDNAQYLADGNNEILEAIRNAVEIVNWELRRKAIPANARMEEQAPYNSFGDLDYLEREAHVESIKRRKLSGKGQPRGIVETLYNRAMDEFKYNNSIDELIHRLAIQAHPVDKFGYFPDMDKRDAIRNFWEMTTKIHNRLKQKENPYRALIFGPGTLRLPGKIIGKVESGTKANGEPRYVTRNLSLHEMNEAQLDESLKQILEFRWNLMKRLTQDFQLEQQDRRSEFGNGLYEQQNGRKGRILLANVSRDFRVVDDRGREIPIDYIKEKFATQPNEILKKLDNKEWRIQFFRLSSEPSMTAIMMQFADMGKLDELAPIWQHRYKALRALYLNGRPNEDASNMSWDAIPALERALKAMETNHTVDDKGGLSRVFSDFIAGEAEIFLRSEEGRRFLGEYRECLEKLKADNPFTDEFKMMNNYDPLTDLPYDWIEDEIDERSHIIIDVPDTHLRNPLEDIRHSPYALVVDKLSKSDRKKIIHGQLPVVLRGMQTGRLYHSGQVNLNKLPAENASYADFYEQSRRAYEDDAGIPFPKNGYLLRVGTLAPIGNARLLDYTMQTFKVPEQHFDGLVSPRLAYFNDNEPLTGLVLPADYCPQKVTPGDPVRFREMKGTMGSKMDGHEGHETGHLYESTLRSCRRLTVGDLLEEVNSGALTEEQARRYGYAGAYDMWEKVNQAFVNRRAPKIMDQEILLLEFDAVDKSTWAYDPPFSALRAAFTKNGQPVPPVRNFKAANENSPDPAPEQKCGGNTPRIG